MPDRACYDDLADALLMRDAPLAEIADAKARAGLAVYRNNVRHGLSKALGEKFPVTAALVGEAFFKFAAREYFLAAPPASPLIADYGDRFPAFLETFEPARKLPYLADVARIEIAWLEAYRAADAEPLGPDALGEAAQGDPGRLVFRLHPSLRLMRATTPAGSIWLRHKGDGERVIPAVDKGEHVMIIRPAHEVRLLLIERGVFEATASLQRGENVAEACLAAAGADPSFEPAALFQLLIEQGAVIAIV